MLRSTIAVLFLTVACAAFAIAAPEAWDAAGARKAAAKAGWPATREGEAGYGYVHAFNRGEDAMKAFYAREYHPDSLAKKPPEKRLTRYREIREKFGSLSFGAVVEQKPGELAVTLMDADAAPHVFVFACQKKPPFKLQQVAMRETRNVGHGHGGGGFHH